MVEKLQDDNNALRQEIKNLEQRKASLYQNTVSGTKIEGTSEWVTSLRYLQK